MEDNKLEKFMKKISENYKTIGFEDNKKGIKYSIIKDNDGKYIIEMSTKKEIDSNNDIDVLFNEMNAYFDSINENDYWPKESEYPDMYVLWRAFKSDKEELKKSGALSYPEEWDSILEKFKNI